MKNIKEISIRWITNTVGFFIVRYIIELIHPTSYPEHRIIWVALEAILFGIIMIAFERLGLISENKQRNKTNKKEE